MSHKRARVEKSPKWEPITVVNVVITASVECELDLTHIASTLMNVEYYPKKFAALKLCRLDPYAKALVFTSGKLVCVGSASIEYARDSLNWFIGQLQGTMPEKPFTIRDVTVQNVVGTTKMCSSLTKINLRRVYNSAPTSVQYEPVSLRFYVRV